MECPQIYRKRLIPDECIALKDAIHRYDSDIITTSWSAIHPRADLHHGCSCYYRKEGWKVSRFYNADGALKYTYCDIVAYEENPSDNSLVVTDLLADVIIYPDGMVHVVDIDELSEAFTSGLLSAQDLCTCLNNLNALLERIYKGELSSLTSPLDSISFSA